MPVDYTRKPRPSDIEEMLSGATWWPEVAEQDKTSAALKQAEMNIDAAVAELENRTGWRPFVSSGVSRTYYYDKTDYGGYLNLHRGFQSISSVTVAGQSYTLNTQYVPRPSGAIEDGQAFLGIKFSHSVYGGDAYGFPDRIAVTGIAGRYAIWPGNAWVAVFRAAAVMTLTTINIPQDPAGWGEGVFNESYDVVGIITPKDVLAEWSKQLDPIIQQYKIVGVY